MALSWVNHAYNGTLRIIRAMVPCCYCFLGSALYPYERRELYRLISSGKDTYSSRTTSCVRATQLYRSLNGPWKQTGVRRRLPDSGSSPGATQGRKAAGGPDPSGAVDLEHWFLLVANPPQPLYVLATHCASIASYTHFGRACATKAASY